MRPEPRLHNDYRPGARCWFSSVVLYGDPRLALIGSCRLASRGSSLLHSEYCGRRDDWRRDARRRFASIVLYGIPSPIQVIF